MEDKTKNVKKNSSAKGEDDLLKTPRNREEEHFVKYGDKEIYVAKHDEIVPNCEGQTCSFSINNEDDNKK